MAISPCGGPAYRISLEGREMISHGTPLFPIAFYHDDLEKDRVSWHWHDELEAVVVSSGETTVWAGTHRYQLREGQGFFVNAGVLHAAIGVPGTNCRYHSLVFHPRLIADGVDSVFWQSYMHPLTAGALKSAAFDGSEPWHAEALRQVETAWQEGAADAPGFEFRVRAALSELIFLLTRRLPTERGRTAEKTQRDTERIKRMLSYIKLHSDEELSVADIAASAMISLSECLRCFRTMIGMTPIQYVKRYRVQRAAELLTSTDRKIAEIAGMCGFQDTSYFTRAFREIKGCTPGEYRRIGER